MINTKNAIVTFNNLTYSEDTVELAAENGNRVAC